MKSSVFESERKQLTHVLRYEEIKVRQKLIRRVEFIVCIYSEMVRFIQIREMMVLGNA